MRQRFGGWAISGATFGGLGALSGLIALVAGCPAPPAPPDVSNTSDPTNGGAAFVGASACRQCHSAVADLHGLHGHAFALSGAQGRPPEFPPAAEAGGAGVPTPPDGFDWTDIAYVVGGYTKAGFFVDMDGFVVTTGTSGVASQWNLGFGPNGTPAGLREYEPARTTPLAFDFDCFRCHTTGAVAFDPEDPRFQDGRPGMAGTFAEAGVQCEACHGPGSGHFGTTAGQVEIRKAAIFSDPDGSDTCRTCHSRTTAEDDGRIFAADGFIANYQQWNELQASGGHASLACTYCHNPHRSLKYDRAAAIRNECQACHPEATMAGHAGAVYVRGDYREELSCESCHMPYAAKNASAALLPVMGDFGRVGDVRSHLFRIGTQPEDFTAFFTADGGQVQLDDQGQAALTVDFVCLRCHVGDGLFELSVERAAEIAPNVHDLPE